MASIKPANSIDKLSTSRFNEPIWLKDPTLLVTNLRWKEFFPTTQMSREQAFNAGSRLIIYLSLLLFIYSRRSTYLATGVVALVLGYVWYQYYPKMMDNFTAPTPGNLATSGQPIQSQYTTTPPPVSKRKYKYVEPSDNNPFMNVMPDDYVTNPGRASILQKPCHNFNEIQAKVEQKFHQGLFQDVGDVFGRDASQRQFYTTPNTAIPNDQDNFAQWLYKSDSTCKQGTCEADLRYIGR
jgi:hypothetical protein